MITIKDSNNKYKESNLLSYKDGELRDLFEPLVTLHETVDHDTRHWLEGGEVRSIDTEYDVVSWQFGSFNGRKLYDPSEDELYRDLVNELNLFTIIKDFCPFIADCWELMPIWEADDIVLHDEGLIELFHTKDESERISILDRAIEAAQLLDVNVITRLGIKLSREALRLERGARV